MRGTYRAPRWSSVATLVGVAVAASGCGSDDDYENRPRPPAPIIVTASISDEKVSVSPREFGAGPVTLVITNQSSASQQLTLDGPSLKQETGPISPRETASLKANVPQGEYSVSVAGDDITAASLEVGPERESAQNDLLQP